jgi:prepilin-type N-terminal cleavage/methylation domain-containing protein
MQTNRSTAGFTLIEVLVTVGVMALLASVVIIGVNPARQISNTRNAQRTGNIANIQGAINHYAIETFTGYPAGIDSTFRMIGTAASGCAVSCGPDTLPPPPPAGITSFADDSQSEFDAGTHTNTQWSPGNSSVQLSGSGLAARTGTFVSKIFDAGSSANWNAFSYMPRAPYGKELLNSAVSESSYPTNNMSMANNVLLMHLNETSGTIVDSSGNGNTGAVTAITYNQTGKLKSALSFNGSSSFVQSPNTNSLKLSNTGGSISLWIKPTVNLAQTAGMGIIRKVDYGPYWPGIGGYGLEIFRATPGGNQVIKGQLGYNNGSTNPTQTITGTTNIVSGNWYHVAMVWNTSTIWLYVNGVQDATPITRNGTATLSWQSATPAPLYI